MRWNWLLKEDAYREIARSYRSRERRFEDMGICSVPWVIFRRWPMSAPEVSGRTVWPLRTKTGAPVGAEQAFSVDQKYKGPKRGFRGNHKRFPDAMQSAFHPFHATAAVRLHSHPPISPKTKMPAMCGMRGAILFPWL